MNHKAIGLKGLDMTILWKGTFEELQSDLRGIDGIEGFHDNDIEEAVLHAGIGGNVGIVAILRGIGTGDEEGLAFLTAAVALDGVGLGFIEKAFLEGILDIGQEASPPRFGKLLTDEGIKTHTAGAEEGTGIDGAIVQRLHDIAIDDFDGFTRFEGDMKMAGESVS